jgi:hypothetical protein
MAFPLCSEKRPVRKGQILPRGDLGTVKYLSYGRNIVQQETESRKGQPNYGGAAITFLRRVFQRKGDWQVLRPEDL